MSERTPAEQEVVDDVAGTAPARPPARWRALDGAMMTLAQGAAAGRESATLLAELSRIAIGRSDVDLGRDGRFRDPAWTQNPAYHRLAQSYLASCRAVDNLVDNLDDWGWKHAQTARFVATIATSSLAPTNVLPGNPAALKKALDTGGQSLVSGLGNWLTDLRSNGGMPATAKKGQFVLGEQLAATPGAVIARDEVGEVIQYAPVTEQVYARPTLVIPPPIGRYYFLDLAPGRSFVEHAVGQGIQTFMLSWRNPTKEQAAWDIDTYAQRVVAAIEEVREVTGQEAVNVIGFCAGGILSAVAQNALAARGDGSVHSASYAVTLLDWGGENPINPLRSSGVLAITRMSTRRRGVITARDMGSAFTWMRPNDLVWNYWVNNYLLGQDPPPFDILSWNADGTNLPAQLHLQFLDIFSKNPLPEACARAYLGTPLDLSTLDRPTFVVGAVNDHLTPWKGTYRTTELTGGDSTYVLSSAGHIAALVNPPSNPKASYFTGANAGEVDAQTWQAGAVRKQGSWWSEWATWTIERAGDEVAAPQALGSAEHPALTPAPGLYVRDAVPQ